MFYKAVVQVVIIFVSETFVVTPLIGRMMGGFNHQVVFQMMIKEPWRYRHGICRHPPLYVVMEEAGLEEVVKYVSHRHKMSAQYIADRTIMDLCLEA